MRTPPALAKRLVRRARRLPGYRWLRRNAVGRIRRSETAREVVNRVFAGSGSGSRRIPRRFPHAGNLLDGLGVDQLPVAVISLIGVPNEKVGEVIDDIARLQILSASFRPVFVMDCPKLDSPRRYGYVAELLIAPSEWAFPDIRWSSYAAERLSDIVQRYEASIAVTVPPSGMTESVRLMLEAGATH